MSRPRTTPLARDDSPAALMAAGVPGEGDTLARSRARARNRRDRRTDAPSATQPRVKHRAAPPTGRQVEPQCLPDAPDALPLLALPPLPVLDLRRARLEPPARRRETKTAPSALARRLEPGLTFAELVERLPAVGAAADFRSAAAAIADARLAGRGVVLGMGAEPIALGLSPLIIDLMERRVITAVALDGAALVHALALADAGRTIDRGTSRAGRSARTRETGTPLNRIVRDAATREEGLGAAVGRHLAASGHAPGALGIAAAAARLGITVTVHPAIGADEFGLRASADAAALGASSQRDFQRFASVVAGLAHGVYVSLGSTMSLRAVLRNALELARGLGHAVRPLVTIDLAVTADDPPATDVVRGPAPTGLRALHLPGQPELLFPLLAATVLDRLAGAHVTRPSRRR